MTQRKEDANISNTPTNSTINNPCWWSEEVFCNDQSPSPYNDFVLISEFSELEGPLPLAIVIGDDYIDLKHYTDKHSMMGDILGEQLRKMGLELFDFNAFVLRVVSVDRSTEYDEINEEVPNPSPISPSTLLEETENTPYLFSIPDDTQVYFTDSEHKFFAFTHHLTLFDINARGYVHPVALSYIARDPNKIIHHFEELMDRFNQVSVKMKQGNYSNFTLDLKCRLLDLEYTQSHFITDPPPCKPSITFQALHQAVIATQFMIDTLESSMGQLPPSNDTSTPHHSPPTHTQRPSSILKKKDMSIDPPKDYKPKYIDTLYPIAHFERKLRSLAQLCQEPDEEFSLENDRMDALKPTTTVIPLVFSMIEAQSTNTSNHRTSFSKSISHDMYSEAIKYLQDITCHFGQNSVVLDVGDDEALFVEPVSSAITMGRTFMLNVDNPKPREKENKEEKTMVSGGRGKKEEDSKDYFPISLAPFQLWESESLHRRGSPVHLLEILRRYHTLIVDVIFSIMTGRTVLVQGSENNKSLIMDVVRALAVFVPGHNKEHHCIIEWFEEDKLTDYHIRSIKLVGIDKNKINTSIHIGSSCVLDIDTKHGSLNSSPVYVEGQWVNQLIDRLMLFSSDESYLAYLHTIFMTMSLKTFVYYHLNKTDEFKIEDTPTDTTVNKGYISETNSESSINSRKWSVRIMNYIKKKEREEEREDGYADDTSTTGSVTEEDDKDYSDENQATITLHNIQQMKENKPRPLQGLFDYVPAPSKNLEKADHEARRESVTTNYSRRASIDSEEDLNHMMDGSFLNFGKEDFDFGSHMSTMESEEDDDSQSIQSDNGSLGSLYHEQVKSARQVVEALRQKIRASKKDDMKQSDLGPDGVSHLERRGRKYLQDKFKVYGDDQTIIVYLASSII
ncbi:hypothetical protein BDB01DRAFT_786173 [Pilobolus umbonatus]|nr:hypothetical protein BDB01DRAFT_786173 [Pilobolus umbonatus]